MSNWIRLLRWPLVIALIAGGIFYLRTRPKVVRSHTVSRASIVAELMGTGTLEARIQTTISPKISGLLEEVLVDQGITCKRGRSW